LALICAPQGLLEGCVIAGVLAAFLYFGEPMDTDSGDLLGFVGWVAHFPFAMVLIHGIHKDLYSDALSWPLFLTALAFWFLSSSALFYILPRLRPPRFQSANETEYPGSA